MDGVDKQRTGTIPVPLVLENEWPWKKIAIGGISSLAFLLILSLATRPTAQKNPHEVVEQVSQSDPEAALQLAAGKLTEAEEETRQWREYLAENYLKAGNKEKARTHYAWLVRNYPKDKEYKKGLAQTSPKKKGKK